MRRRRRLIAGALAIVVVAVGAWLYLRADAPLTGVPPGPRSARDEAAPPAPCDHPYVPLLPGTRWRYRVTSDVETTEATVSGRVASRGRIQWTAEGAPPARPTVWSVVVRCGEDGAEEPWFGLLDGMLGSFSLTSSATPVIDTRRWRVPRSLSPGATFGGEARLERPTSDETFVVEMERHYRVLSTETVSLPDGSAVEAWRLSFTDRQRADGHEAQWTGDMWLVEGIGMVRMELAPGGHSMSWELVDHIRPS